MLSAACLLALSTACVSEYHPEYHPETSYSYVQNVVLSPPPQVLAPIVIFGGAPSEAAPAPAPTVAAVARLHAGRPVTAARLEAAHVHETQARPPRPFQALRAYAADDAAPSPSP